MRGSSRPTSTKNPGHYPSNSVQLQSANSAQIYTSQRPSSYFDGSYANQQQKIQQFGLSVGGNPIQGGPGANNSSQFVQQVIYNQGSVVINNAGSGPSMSIPQGSGYAANNYANNTVVDHRANLAVQNAEFLGHQKTKSLSAATNQQNPLLGTNGAPVQSSHHRYPTNLSLPQEVTRKIYVKPQQQTVQIQPASIQENSHLVQINSQNIQKIQQNHKKTKSLAQNKITQLLIQSQKKVQKSQHVKVYEQQESQQETIDQIQQQFHQGQQHKNHPNTDKEKELLKILRDQRTVQELSYQNQSSNGSRDNSTFTQSFGKHTRAATQGANQLISSYEKAVRSQATSVQQTNPTQKSVRPSSSNKPVLVDQQQKSVRNQQTNSFIVVPDKIASSGKVIASGAMIKKASVNKNSSAQQQMNNNPALGQQSQHHRIKSDQHYSLKAKEMFVGQGVVSSNLVLNQKGKVGKILKNNFVESAIDHQQNLVSARQIMAPTDKSLNSSIGGHSSFNLGQNGNNKSINRTYQHPPGSQQIQAVNGQQIGQEVALQSHKKQISITMTGGVIQNQTQQQVQSHKKILAKETKNKQSTRDKYVQLQGLYNQLLERHTSLLHKDIKPTTSQIQASASTNSNISLNQFVQNQVQQKNKNVRVNQLTGAGQTNPSKKVLFTLGAQEEAINQNPKPILKVDSRDMSLDSKQKNKQFQANIQNMQKEMRVPPQSSTSSVSNQKPTIIPHLKVIDNQTTSIQFSAGEISSNLVSLTSDLNRQDPIRKSQIDSMQKVTPLSSGRSSSQFVKQLNQMQINTQQDQQFQLSGNKVAVFAIQNEVYPSKQNIDVRRHKRSVSNGRSGTSSQNLIVKQQVGANYQITHQREISAHTAQPTIIQSQLQQYQDQSKQVKSPLKTQERLVSDKMNTMNRIVSNSLEIAKNEEFKPKKLNAEIRTKSNYKPIEANNLKDVVVSFLFKNDKAAELNNKFKVSLSTQESPKIEKRQFKGTATAFHHPQINLQIPKANLKKQQAMVIEENTPPQSPGGLQNVVLQLSDWDQMIQNNKSVKVPMVNNLIREPAQAQALQPTKKGHHIKNKHSVHSDASVQNQARQNSFNQYEDNLAQLQQQHPNLQFQDRPNHKRVKSDVVEQNARELISIADFVHSQGKIAGYPNMAKSKPHSTSVNTANSNKTAQKEDVITHQIESAFQRGGKNLKDNKVVNISIEQIDVADDDQVVEALLQNPAKDKSKNQNERGPESQRSSELIKNDKYKHILRRAKVTYNGQKKTGQQTQPAQISIQEQQFVKKAPLQIVQSREVSNVPLNSVNQSIKNTPKYDRIETQESIESNITPKERIIKKLTHHVRDSFKRTGDCPQTTVEFYRVGKILGKGAFGKVNLAQQQLTQLLVAIKSINKTHFSEESQSKKVMQEVMILKQTRHRNIIRLFEYFETQKHILFVIELSSGGDLLSYVRKRRQLKEEVAKSVFKQLIEGIKYCHSKKILHRDIKLDNILLTIDGVVKICDFGVSKIVKNGEKMSEQCGTPAYIAPEILLDKGYEGFAVDIWSAGVVLYAMLYGTVPFKANNMSELQKMIIKAKFTLQDGISKEAKDLLKQLLDKEPLQRITIPNILVHPWMKDAKDTVELFTNAEKNYMKYEFSCQEQGGLPELDFKNGDPFMDQMLDTLQNSELKNAETKSIVLAPFNSTKSNLEQIERNFSLPSEIKELIQSKSCLKFAPKVREIDKQYEVNNNAELDNGVYHDFNKDEKPVEKEDSLQSDFRETLNSQNKKPQTELQKLEKMILKQEAVRDYSQLKTPQDTNFRFSSDDVVASNEPIQVIGKWCASNFTFVDDDILQQVVQFGYSGKETRKYLQKCELNSATTTYYLLEIQKQSSLADTTQNLK